MARSPVFYFFVVGISAAIILAIVALALSRSGNDGGTTIINNIIGGEDTLFSIYDDKAQPLLSNNTWTNIFFDRHLYGVGGAFLQEASFGSDIILCNRTGFYTVFFSIQAQINTNFIAAAATATQVVPLECKTCNLRYSIRATRQAADSDSIFEVPGSLTYSGGMNFYLSKQFVIDATAGDLFRFQFASPCGQLSLQPSPYVFAQEPTPAVDSFPASVTLVISS